MLFKISLSSMRKMMKDYIVLLVGLVISISIFYMFQTLAVNETFIKSNSMINSIALVFIVGSVLLSIITFFYIIYANSFLLSLRRKEFGMYMTLGAKKGKIIKLMFIETMAVGIIALIIGIVLGTGMAQIVGNLLMNQLDFASSDYHPFYMPAVGLTVAFFIIIFFITALLNAFKLARTTILNLVHADSQQDRIEKKRRFTFLIAILALIFLSAGYYAIVHMEQLAEMGLLIGTFATTIGTYLFFIAVLPFIVNLLKNNEKLNSTGLNSFTFSQLKFRVNSLTKLLATIAMLIALGVGAITGGMAFNHNTSLMSDLFYAYDAAIHDPVDADVQAIGKMKVVEDKQYHYKLTDTGIYFAKDELLQDPPLGVDSTSKKADKKREPQIIRLNQELPDQLYSDTRDDVDKKTASQIPEIWRSTLEYEFNAGYRMFDKTIYIADQNTYRAIEGNEHVVRVVKSDDFVANKAIFKDINERQVKKSLVAQNSEDLGTKYSMYQSLHTMSSGTMFMGFFLGIAFLAMMASCLMFKILSGASRDTSRYQMLRKIGVRKQLLTKSIYKELGMLFLFPAIVGLIHVVVGMNIFSFILVNPYFKIWLPITMFVAIYAVYYFVTVQLYRGIVLPKEPTE
ncbi:ABC transporter permease [Paenibacillus albiflavus]|uniref:ABC transporter permease n=1 Tax=Paenibacillus albiflavus TaxID=2545760 RepID=A0A4R4EP18_9BACL|nr:ABC transporter permease [Paenibacillus albiflavus]TCZ80118.1 ABC transporter permease [Paenibacillus albiflavus]